MVINIKRYQCESCAHKAAFQDGSPACAFHKRAIDPNEDFCSWHTSSNDSISCPICGQTKRQNEFFIFPIEDKNVIVCSKCAQYIGTCATCVRGNICPLANDHSAPQVIPQTVQQGNMIMTIQIKNPKLVVKHCQKCKCSDGSDPSIKDVVCFKDENGTLCSHWQILPQLLQ